MTHIPDSLRRSVFKRAEGCCEYCLIHQDDAFKRHEIDHIAAEKHGGETIAENLCLSCMECNRHKSSDLTSYDPETGEITLLFHPRQQTWTDHFALQGDKIIGLTPTGRTTIFLLHLNDDDRVLERGELIKLNRYPLRSI